MRIVSQDKYCDVNYDKIQIIHQKREGYHCVVAVLQVWKDGDCLLPLGEYESEQKCLEVMERVRNSYARGAKIYYMPPEE